MRKKIFLLILFLMIVNPVRSQEPSGEESEPTPTNAVTDKIQELKERVANRVAALKKDKLGGLTGLVKSSSDSALILNVDGDDYSIQLDEEAKVYSVDSNLRKKEVKLSELDKDATASVIGVVDKDEKTATAQLIVLKRGSISIFGNVLEVSTKDGTITVSTREGKKYTADIEVSTKSNLYNNQTAQLAKVGLSKIEKDSRIHVYGIAGEEENRITALRVLILPKSLTVSEKPITPTNKPSPTPNESE